MKHSRPKTDGDGPQRRAARRCARPGERALSTRVQRPTRAGSSPAQPHQYQVAYRTYSVYHGTSLMQHERFQAVNDRAAIKEVLAMFHLPTVRALKAWGDIEICRLIAVPLSVKKGTRRAS